VWDIGDPNKPYKALTINSEILCVSFNPKHQNLLGTGCSNGTVAIFDISEGVTHNLICQSKLEESHNDAITDLVWLRSRNGTEFVTTSTDGKVIWWDIKDLNLPTVNVVPENPEKPLMLVDKENDVEKEYGGVKIEYNPEAGVSIFVKIEGYKISNCN